MILRIKAVQRIIHHSISDLPEQQGQDDAALQGFVLILLVSAAPVVAAAALPAAIVVVDVALGSSHAFSLAAAAAVAAAYIDHVEVAESPHPTHSRSPIGSCSSAG
jgi:hypothetical protein